MKIITVASEVTIYPVMLGSITMWRLRFYNSISKTYERQDYFFLSRAKRMAAHLELKGSLKR